MRIEDRILFIDGEAIVLDKPGGMPVDAPRDGALAIANHLDLLRYGFQRQPLPVHRLDRDTSGCLLLARNLKAHKRFTTAWEEGAVDKIYLAVVQGAPGEQQGLIDLPLAKQSTREDGWRIVGDRRGKAAHTRWQLIATIGAQSLLLFHPLSGRTHQIRVHAAEGLGLPIAGDPVYGDRRGAMLLHAAALTVPRGRKPAIKAHAPVPASFGAFQPLWSPDVAA